MPETTPSVSVAEDLVLVGPDGTSIAGPLAPRDALHLAEDLTRTAFTKMLIEETLAIDRKFGLLGDPPAAAV